MEWLSHFVEDSNFSEYSLPFPATLAEKVKSPEPGNTGFTYKTSVPTKTRSKPTRTSVRVWPLTSSTVTTTTPTTSSPSSSSPSSPLLAYAAADPRVKKHVVIDSAVAARRCNHCGVQKTPQWRIGPLGAKTLCNACGVRFKSGRLLPEYRPACSPTFSIKLHSNHHRKVLEMRRKKEVTPEPDTSSPRSIPNFWIIIIFTVRKEKKSVIIGGEKRLDQMDPVQWGPELGCTFFFLLILTVVGCGRC